MPVRHSCGARVRTSLQSVRLWIGEQKYFRIFLDSRQWWELIGSPLRAPSSDKTSFYGRFESVSLESSLSSGRKAALISKERALRWRNNAQSRATWLRHRLIICFRLPILTSNKNSLDLLSCGAFFISPVIEINRYIDLFLSISIHGRLKRLISSQVVAKFRTQKFNLIYSVSCA
jgi:hypothetical protein